MKINAAKYWNSSTSLQVFGLVRNIRSSAQKKEKIDIKCVDELQELEDVIKVPVSGTPS